jgi:uncharacterized protein (TIGR03437 family)
VIRFARDSGVIIQEGNLRFAIALLILSQSAQAQSIFGKNLIVNGDAEAGSASSSGGTAVASIPGWTASGSPNVLPYGLKIRLQPTSIGPVNRGANYFAGVNTAKAVLTQKVDISAAASAIDAGSVSYDASGYLGGDSEDSAQMLVTFLGASGNTLTAVTLGPVAHSDRYQEPSIYLRRQIGLVPAGARSATVELDLIRASGSENDGVADNLSLVLNSGGSSNALFNTNVIVNGTGDAPTGSTGSDFALDTPGWVRSANFTIEPYAAMDDLSPTDPGPADRGANYFYGGPGNELSTATQDVDLSAAAAQIDTGKVTFNFTAWIGGYSSQNDNITVKAEFRDWSGKALGSSTLGPVSSADRNAVSSLLQRTQSGGVPSGTRYVRVTLTSVRTDGGDNDGLADSISLTLTAPATTTTPTIQSGGVVTASAFGGFKHAAPGSWIEIYGSGLATDTRGWAGSDFNGTNAPTALNGTSVTIGGQRAFVSYISPTQVNVQVPSNIAAGPQDLIVTTPNGSTTAYQLTIAASDPGVLAPPSFIVNGKQYVAALHTDGTFVLPPGAIAGLQTRQAQPGETILIYGIGFGSVTPNVSAGQIVTATNQLTQPVQFLFNGTPGTAQYAGLAPNFVGLYQFNVVVPNVSDNDALPFSFTLGGTPTTQTLYTAVKR